MCLPLRGLIRARSAVCVCALAVSFCAMAGVGAYAASSGGKVPFRLGTRTVLDRHDTVAYPEIGVRTRPVDGSSLAVWDFSKAVNGADAAVGDSVRAERFDALGRPLGAPFIVDSTPPTIPGYHLESDYAPKVAYSPTADSWIVVFQSRYVTDATCRSQRRRRATTGPCDVQFQLMSVRIDPAGQIVGGPNVVLKGLVDGSVACRPGGCVLVWERCRESPDGVCVNSIPADQVALPLDANGAPAASAPVRINSSGRCPTTTYPYVVGPYLPSVASTDSGYMVSWISATYPKGAVYGCLLLRPISPVGRPAGREVRVLHRPRNLNHQVAPFYMNQQICSYNGGRTVLLTWMLGEQSNSDLVPSRDSKYIGVYRQVYSSQGKLVGRDTRSARSINDVPPMVRGTSEQSPAYQQTLSSDSSHNRCVVLAAAGRGVDAYAYNSSGRLTQHAKLVRYHRFDPNNFDTVEAAWSRTAGVLLDQHAGNQSTDFGTVSAFRLQ